MQTKHALAQSGLITVDWHLIDLMIVKRDSAFDKIRCGEYAIV